MWQRASQVCRCRRSCHCAPFLVYRVIARSRGRHTRRERLVCLAPGQLPFFERHKVFTIVWKRMNCKWQLGDATDGFSRILSVHALPLPKCMCTYNMYNMSIVLCNMRSTLYVFCRGPNALPTEGPAAPANTSLHTIGIMAGVYGALQRLRRSATELLFTIMRIRYVQDTRTQRTHAKCYSY